MAEKPAVELGPLGDSLGFLLRLAQLRAFSGFFDALSGHDIRPGELSVLMLLDCNPGIRQGVLARHLSIKRAHMAKMIAQMDSEGWIARKVPEDDRRAMELSLTPAGKAYLAALRPPFERHEGSGAPPLSAKEEEALKTLLRKYLGLNVPSP